MKICFCQGIVLGFKYNVIVFAKIVLGFCNIWVFINRCQNNIGLL